MDGRGYEEISSWTDHVGWLGIGSPPAAPTELAVVDFRLKGRVDAGALHRAALDGKRLASMKFRAKCLRNEGVPEK